MASFNIDTFRAQFPEFKDETRYPAALISAYWSIGRLFISENSPYAALSGDTLNAALNMLAAHLMTLGAAQKGAGGNAAGKTGGFTTSATVGEVSVAKLAPPATNGWQWWLASTPYGQMLWALLSLLSVGGFFVGGSPERESFRTVGGVF